MAGHFDEEESTLVSSAAPKPARVRPRAHLFEVLEGPPAVKNRRLKLEADALILGRAADADLCLESEELSRHHAQLTRRNGEYTCTDLDSLNGVFLNGLRVHSVLLRDGDQLQLGDVTLLYREGA